MIGAKATAAAGAAEVGESGAAAAGWTAAEDDWEERVGEDRRDLDTRLSRAR
jgi:hypothetical protein